jgi:long-subunit acyl-CoA synthetase (AMP-forming)
MIRALRWCNYIGLPVSPICVPDGDIVSPKERSRPTEIMNDVRTLSASNGLTSFETVRAVYLESEPFSVENGLMTPTFKLKRQQMAQNFKKQLDELYREAPSLSSKL